MNRDQAERMFGPAFTSVFPRKLLCNRAFDLAIPGFERVVIADCTPVLDSEIRAYFPDATVDIEDDILDLSFDITDIADKNSKKMLYKIWRCNELKRAMERQRGRRFDLVVRFRPDVVPVLDAALLAEMLTSEPERTIYIPGARGNDLSLNDVLSISSSAVADQYASMFGKAVLAEQLGWNMIHNDLAAHIASYGLIARSTPQKGWINEDFVQRQPRNRALLLRCLERGDVNSDFFASSTTWGALHGLAVAADMLANGAPHAAIVERVLQVDLTQEDVEFLARACGLIASSCEREDDVASLYVTQLIGLICELHLADSQAIDAPKIRWEIERLGRTSAALHYSSIASGETFRSAVNACPPAGFAHALVSSMQTLLSEAAILRSIEQIGEWISQTPEGLLALTFRLLREGDPESAKAVAGELIARRPNEWAGYDALGHAFSAAGQPEEALTCAEQAYAQDQNHGGLAARVGTLLVSLSRPQEALPHFVRSTQLWNDCRPWVSYAECLRQVGRLDDARRAVAEAVARFGNDPALSRLAAEMATPS